MFQTSSPESRLGAAIYLSERIYHASVRKVRQKHGNALLSILVTIGQTALFTLAFYIMFAILPIRAAGIRGDFFIYTMSGVFLFTPGRLRLNKQLNTRIRDIFEGAKK